MKVLRPLFLFLLLSPRFAAAQIALDQDVDLEDVDTSYIYPVVMGTGVYQIDGRKLAMLTIPISITQQREDDDDHEYGLKWYAPVTIGYDQISDTNWLGKVLTDELVTLSIMPGAQLTIPLSDNWLIRPFGQAGIGQDFVSHETFALAALGVRVLGTWKYDSGWEVRWGGAVRYAAEYQFKSHNDNGFALMETGVDVRRDTGFSVMENKISAGVYYELQSYLPEWTLGEYLVDRSNIHEVHELGISMGLAKPRKVFGVSLTRVRVGYKKGSGVKGWTFGTEFPF
ncbi:MAG: hypothetical protein V7742_05390 [Halioglobus sp.]